MKLLLLIDTLNSGGAERIISYLSLTLNFEICLVVFGKSDSIYETTRNMYCLNLPYMGPEILIDKPREIDRLAKMVKSVKKKEEIDVSLSFLLLPNIVNVMSKYEETCMISVRNNYTHKFKGYRNYGSEKRRSAVHQVELQVKKLYPLADKIIAISKGCSDDLIENFSINKEKISVIYNFSNINKVRELSKEKTSSKLDKLFDHETIITVGRLHYQKNHLNLIRIYSEIRRRRNIKLIIIGDGSLRNKIIDYIKRLSLSYFIHDGLKEYNNQDIVFVDKTRNPFKYLSRATCFVFPSIFEGFGNAILEALACRCPVVVSDCKSGPREILAPNSDFSKQTLKPEITENGILMPVPFDNGQQDSDWVKIIINIIDNKEMRENFAINGLRRALYFDYKKNVSIWNDFLKENAIKNTIKKKIKNNIYIKNIQDISGIWEERILYYASKISCFKMLRKSSSYDISIVIASNNIDDKFFDNFRFLSKNIYHLLEIIIVTESISNLKQLENNVIISNIIEVNTKCDKSVLRNIGAIFADSREIFFIDDVSYDFNSTIYRYLIDKREEASAILFYSHAKLDGVSQDRFYKDKKWMVSKLNYFGIIGIMMKTNLFYLIGGFHHDLPDYTSSLEILFRLKSMGYVIQEFNLNIDISSKKKIFRSKINLSKDRFTVFCKVFGKYSLSHMELNRLKQVSDLHYGRELFQAFAMKKKLGYLPDLFNPTTFNEKLAFLMINDVQQNISELADKLLVRNYVTSKGFSHILNKLYCSFNNVDDLNLDLLPDSFVIKVSNGSGQNIIVKDKSKASLTELKQKIKGYMAKIPNMFFRKNEYQYLKVNPNILIEKLIIDEKNDSLTDYKLHCFHGKVKFIQVDIGRFRDHKRIFYDNYWKEQNFTTEYPKANSLPRPIKLDEMIAIAEILSNSFIYVRVDLYCPDDVNIFFGELTFTPAACNGPFYPREYDRIVGSMIDLKKMGEKKLHSGILENDLKTLNLFSEFFSVCIPTYNRAHFLKDAIQSALNLNYDNYEIVIVDDGSTDNTKEVVESFYSNKIRYIYKEHTSQPDTRNRMIKEARYNYIVNLDSDDLLDREILNVYNKYLSEYPDVDVLYCNICVFDNESKKILSKSNLIDWYKKNDELLGFFFTGNPIRHPGTLVRKKVFEENSGYNTDFTRAQDFELWSRLAIKKKYNFKLVENSLVYFRSHGENITGRKSKIEIDLSHNIKVLDNIFKKVDIRILFPQFNWNNYQDSLMKSYIKVANRYLNLNGLDEAQEVLKKYFYQYGQKKIINDVYLSISYLKDCYLKQFDVFYRLSKIYPQNITIKTYFEFLSRVVKKEKSVKLNSLKDISISSLLRFVKFHYKNRNYIECVYLMKTICFLTNDMSKYVVILLNFYLLRKDLYNAKNIIEKNKLHEKFPDVYDIYMMINKQISDNKKI